MFIILFSIKLILVHALTCDEVLELPSNTKLTLSDIKTMEPKHIMQCLVHLGKERLGDNEAQYLWKTIVKFHDGTENIPDKVLSQLHWITSAITPQEYNNITLASIDVVENFGLNYGLDESQLTAIANRVREDFAGKEPEDYTYYDLSALRQILCSFNRSEIERIRPAAYRETALLIGNLECCSTEAMMGFATLAVHKKAFGNPENWSESILKIIGKVADYIPKEFPQKFDVHPSLT